MDWIIPLCTLVSLLAAVGAVYASRQAEKSAANARHSVRLVIEDRERDRAHEPTSTSDLVSEIESGKVSVGEIPPKSKETPAESHARLIAEAKESDLS
jgi:hypothetical protein